MRGRFVNQPMAKVTIIYQNSQYRDKSDTVALPKGLSYNLVTLPVKRGFSAIIANTM